MLNLLKKTFPVFLIKVALSPYIKNEIEKKPTKIAGQLFLLTTRVDQKSQIADEPLS